MSENGKRASESLAYIDSALRLAEKRHAHILRVQGGETLEPMYNSIVQQLIYLRKVITGEEKDKAKLWQLTFGIYATKEFEATDPLFEDRLGNAFYIASQIRRGLKVQLPHQVDPNFQQQQQKLRDACPEDFED